MWITNNGDMVFDFRWNGLDYSMQPGDSIELDAFGAESVFGYGLEDKTPILIKHGIMKKSDEWDSVKSFFDGFTFTQEKPSVRRGRPPKESAGTAPIGGASE